MKPSIKELYTMSFTELLFLLEKASVMEYIAFFFVFNLSLIAVELLLDVCTAKKRRWGILELILLFLL
ncbi:hypothetical protein [Aquimarina hainanensis]|uniref:hypothetical protein n=1 Tax=Aquimarina hainanensis TaxID=1578017 RepID=UPI0036063EB0